MDLCPGMLVQMCIWRFECQYIGPATLIWKSHKNTLFLLYFKCFMFLVSAKLQSCWDLNIKINRPCEKFTFKLLKSLFSFIRFGFLNVLVYRIKLSFKGGNSYTLLQPKYHGLILEVAFHWVQWNWGMDPVFLHNYQGSLSLSHSRFLSR